MMSTSPCASANARAHAAVGSPTRTADSTAAQPETEKLRQALVVPQQTGAFASRWLDDRKRVYQLPAPRWIRQLDGRTFYGQGTELLKTDSGVFAGLRIWVLPGHGIWTAPMSPNEEALIVLGIQA